MQSLAFLSCLGHFDHQVAHIDEVPQLTDLLRKPGLLVDQAGSAIL